MLLIPSIDLRGGHCVRLLKGEFDAETRYDIDPAELLGRCADAGVRWLHLVDLDGARDGTPGNRELIRRMASQSRIRIQLGGGLRSRALVDEALAAGVSRAVIGSAAVEDPSLLRALLADYGADRVCLAIDVRVDEQAIPRVRTRGWVKEHALSLWELLTRRTVSPKVVNILWNSFAALLLATIAYISFRDVRGMFNRGPKGGTNEAPAAVSNAVPPAASNEVPGAAATP